jgi:FkbM family methyltransferase
MSATASPSIEDYTRNSWRRGAALYLEHPFINGARWFRYMTRRSWPGRVLHFTDGQGNRYLSMKNNFTSFAVAVLGERDPNVMRFLRRWIRPGFIACDIGANIGTYTVPLARLVGPAGHVIAFEPNRPTCACLRQNIRQNRLSNVTLLRAAAGPEAGTAGLVVTADNLGEVHLAPPGDAENARVTVTTVDAEVSRLRLHRVEASNSPPCAAPPALSRKTRTSSCKPKSCRRIPPATVLTSGTSWPFLLRTVTRPTPATPPVVFTR